MRLIQLVETKQSPFDEVQLSNKEQREHDARRSDAAKHNKWRTEQKLAHWFKNGKLEMISKNTKLKPGEYEVFFGGKRYRTKTADKTEIDRILKSNKALERHIEDVAQTDNTSSLRVIAITAKRMRKRWQHADELVIKALKDAAAGKELKHWGEIEKYIEFTVKEPWPEIEPYIYKWPSMAEQYVNVAYPNVRWQWYEQYLITNATKKQEYKWRWAERIASYVRHHLKQPWPQVEPILLSTSLDQAYSYFRASGKTSWPEFEKQALQAVQLDNHMTQGIQSYLTQVKKRGWPELEQRIIDVKAGKFGAEYQLVIGRTRWSAFDAAMRKLILNPSLYSPDPSYQQVSDTFMYYTRYARQQRWDPEVETAMLKYLEDVKLLEYAAEVRKQRWPEMELVIERHARRPGWKPPYNAENYAKRFLNGKWPQIGI